MLRELEVRLGQGRLTYDRKGFSRGRVAGDSTLRMTEVMATEGMKAFYQLNR